MEQPKRPRGNPNFYPGNPGPLIAPRLVGYSKAAREILASPNAQEIAKSMGDGSVLPEGWDATALSGGQLLALKDFVRAVGIGALGAMSSDKATERMLDRAEGKPAMAPEDREALAPLTSGDAYLAFKQALSDAIGEVEIEVEGPLRLTDGSDD